MPELVFFNAKDGNLTFTAGNIAIHSKYNPVAEGLRFVSCIKCDFNPDNIVITEPGLFYCLAELQKKFPASRIISIHYFKETFEKSPCNEKILFNTENPSTQLDNILFDKLGEEGICSTLFLNWQASSNAFSEIDSAAWAQIKAAVNLSRTVLYTRTHFSERWFLNSIKILKNCRNAVSISKTDKPVIVCASGPSLKDMLPFLRKERNRFVILAVSSAIYALIKADIIPDLTISTDGGYWAKKHLDILDSKNEIPLILACEGNCSTKILAANPVIPLIYPDGAASKLFNHLKINSVKGMRNGTVSGTAVDFALNMTSNKVFVCGLDLAGAKGLQHTEPNANEINAFSKDNKLNGREKRHTASRFNSSSLKLYENWFSQLDSKYTTRLLRLSDNYEYSNKLGNIKDINISEALKMMNDNSAAGIKMFSEKICYNPDEVWNYIAELSKSDEWLKEFFAVDYISLHKEINKNQIDEKKSVLSEKNSLFLKKIKKVLQ